MKVKDEIQTIKKSLEVIGAYIENQPKSNEAIQLEWIMRHVAYIERRLQTLLAKTGKQKSYAAECQHNLSHFRDMRRALELWQIHGLPPDDYKAKEDS